MICAPREDLDQPGHLPSLIRDFAVRMKKHPWLLKRTAKTLIRLGECPGWSESLLGAHVLLLVLSWGGSNVHAQPLKGNRVVAPPLQLALVPYIVHGNRGGYDKTMWMHRLVWAVTVCLHLYGIRNLFKWAGLFGKELKLTKMPRWIFFLILYSILRIRILCVFEIKNSLCSNFWPFTFFRNKTFILFILILGTILQFSVHGYHALLKINCYLYHIKIK